MSGAPYDFPPLTEEKAVEKGSSTFLNGEEKGSSTFLNELLIRRIGFLFRCYNKGMIYFQYKQTFFVGYGPPAPRCCS